MRVSANTLTLPKVEIRLYTNTLRADGEVVSFSTSYAGGQGFDSRIRQS